MEAMFANKPHYIEYETRLKELHRLIAEGKGDSDEADEVRDAMDLPYRQLTREEVDRLRGLSADLYMLQDDEIFERFEGTQNELRAALQDAWTRKDWETLLALLRKGPVFLPQEGFAFFRFSAYEGLGHPDTALLFIRHAAELNAQNPRYKELLLNLLTQMGRFADAAEQVEPLIEEPATPRHVLINAAYVLFRTTRKMPEKEERDAHARIIAVLERALKGAQPSPQLSTLLIAGAYMLLGHSYEAFGRIQDARNAYDAALQFEPNLDDARTARGRIQHDFAQSEQPRRSDLVPSHRGHWQGIIEGSLNQASRQDLSSLPLAI